MIKYEVTRDPRLLEQYYDLREVCFRKELSISDFDGAEEEQDRQLPSPRKPPASSQKTIPPWLTA